MTPTAAPLPFTDTLREALRAHMTARTMSSRMAARRIGVSHTTLTRWLKGERGVDSVTIDAVMHYLHTRTEREAVIRQYLHEEVREQVA